MFIEMLWDQPVRYLSIVIVVMFSVVLHELGHAFAAIWEGDSTPRDAGRLDLNPMTHMGPMSLGMLFFMGIAWGQCPVNPARFRHGRMGEAIVSFAGPAVNLLLMVIFCLISAFWLDIAQLLGLGRNLYNNLGDFFNIGAVFNALLFLFNLIPVPPLDGFTVLRSISPAFEKVSGLFAQYGMILFLLVFFVGSEYLWAVSYFMVGVVNAVIASALPV